MGWIMIPQNSYCSSPNSLEPPSLFGDSASPWKSSENDIIKVGLNAVWLVFFQKGETSTHTGRREPAIKAKQRGREQIHPPWPSKETNPANTLISDFWQPKLRQHISLVLATQCVILCYGSASKSTQELSTLFAFHFKRLNDYYKQHTVSSAEPQKWVFAFKALTISWFIT